jgi:hypothetical protein
MDRRKFISVSGISLVGLNGIFSATSSFFPKDKSHEVINFMELLGAERLNRKLSDQQNEYILKACKSWLNLGYKNSDVGFLWKAGEDTIICPMKLSTDTVDSIDNVVLVFTIQNSTGIKYEGSLSGFHLEAISLNQKALLSLGNADFTRSCILPYEVSLSDKRMGTFTTKKGYFELVVKIEKDKTYACSALKVGNQFLWQNSILSNHTLRSHSITLA